MDNHINIIFTIPPSCLFYKENGPMEVEDIYIYIYHSFRKYYTSLKILLRKLNKKKFITEKKRERERENI